MNSGKTLFFRQLHNVLPAAGGAASSSAQITKKTMLRSEFSLYLCIFATSVLIFPFVNLSTYRQESSADYCEKPSDNTDNYNENNCQPAANTYKKEPRFVTIFFFLINIEFSLFQIQNA